MLIKSPAAVQYSAVVLLTSYNGGCARGQSDHLKDCTVVPSLRVVRADWISMSASFAPTCASGAMTAVTVLRLLPWQQGQDVQHFIFDNIVRQQEPLAYNHTLWLRGSPSAFNPFPLLLHKSSSTVWRPTGQGGDPP